MPTVGVTLDRNEHPAWGAKGALHYTSVVQVTSRPELVALCGKPVAAVPRLATVADLVVTCAACKALHTPVAG